MLGQYRSRFFADLNSDAGAGAGTSELTKALTGATEAVTKLTADLARTNTRIEEEAAQRKREIDALSESFKAKAGLPGMPAPTGNPEKDFSLSRAILGHVNRWTGNFAKAPERDILEAYRERVLAGIPMEQRGMVGGVDSAGGFLVSSQTMMGKFIEELLAQPVALQAGCDRMTGLTGGDVVIPGELGGISVTRGAEESTITASAEGYKDFTLRRKQFQGLTSLSLSLLSQTNNLAMEFVQKKLAAKTDLRLDLDFFTGSGAEGIPTGIIRAAGVQTVDWTSGFVNGASQVTTDNLESHVYKLKTANAYRGKVVWFCHPGVTQKVRGVKDSTGKPIFFSVLDLMGKDAVLGANNAIGSGFVGYLYGHPLYETTQLTGSGAGSHLILVNIQDCVWAMWDTVRIEVSEHLYFDKGKVAVRVIGWQDSGVYRGVSVTSAINLTA